MSRQSQQVELYVYELISELKKKMKPSDAVHLEVTLLSPIGQPCHRNTEAQVKGQRHEAFPVGHVNFLWV